MTIPELSLVTLIGPSGCGKSSFARKHFKATEILSSDFCRGLVSDDENNQSATDDAFEVLHFIARKRLASAKLTVVDATNVQPEARKPLIELAREYHVLPVAIVLNLPERLCHDRNQSRPDRDFGPHVVRNQSQQLRKSLRGLEREGFRHVFVLSSVEEVDAAVIERQPLWNNRKQEHGPFDIIGDIHGCCDELEQLLAKLGYAKNEKNTYQHPDGHKVVFVGDLVDRGPRIPETVRVVKDMVDSGHAFCVPGNHDIKFMRAIRGKKVQITHGLGDSLDQFKIYDEQNSAYSRSAAEFIDKLVSHYVFDDGKLVVAHAGMKEEMQGRGSGKVRDVHKVSGSMNRNGGRLRAHGKVRGRQCGQASIFMQTESEHFIGAGTGSVQKVIVALDAAGQTYQQRQYRRQNARLHRFSSFNSAGKKNEDRIHEIAGQHMAAGTFSVLSGTRILSRLNQ